MTRSCDGTTVKPASLTGPSTFSWWNRVNGCICFHLFNTDLSYHHYMKLRMPANPGTRFSLRMPCPGWGEDRLRGYGETPPLSEGRQQVGGQEMIRGPARETTKDSTLAGVSTRVRRAVEVAARPRKAAATDTGVRGKGCGPRCALCTCRGTRHSNQSGRPLS